ncbi:hypothetical protein GURASL_32380 [Geotalea uraniireducens]|uniref:NHL repeat containing protein n=1 Tax=Geotalea uraniireducens TaxID=351604 RepID=A0ABM8ENY2_9BACT|nr:NHL repeat-containing protein [Geotalea uraniireducens]BDV44315.1 hypothetical protein GURASL_32380 [Geotalea uraniireducens]
MPTNLSRHAGAYAICLIATVISLGGSVHGATMPAVTILRPTTEKLATPLRTIFDAQGNCFVADPRAGGIVKFNAGGEVLGILKTKTPPAAIALTAGGNLLVSQGDRVAVLDRNGIEVGRLGSGAGQFKKASGIAVDAAGYIYVADSRDNTVKVFTATGQYVQAIGNAGSAAGQFSMPTGIAYERSANQIAVADTMNGRVQFFSAGTDYRYVKSIGSPLRSPLGIAFEYDQGGALQRLYVVDSFRNCIEVLDPAGSGTLLGEIGTGGYAAGQLVAPVDVTFDRLNRRLVVANGAGYLTIYGIDGGASPKPPAAPLDIDPVPLTVRTPSVTISGTRGANRAVGVTTDTTAVAAPVVYPSATTWRCTISNLAAGANSFTVTASSPSCQPARQSAYVNYAP